MQKTKQKNWKKIKIATISIYCKQKQNKMNKATKKTKKEFPNLKTNGTNRKFIIFLKLKAKRIKK